GVHLRNAPEGKSSHRVEVHSGSLLLATLELGISTPAWRTLEVEIEGGQAAAIGLYTEDGDLLVPDGAADFSQGGYRYDATRYRDHGNASYWPGREMFSRCVFLRDGFSIQVPAGSYRLMASRGPEFMPIDRRLA